MAITKVVMPQMGESITNGTITKWNKKPGDTIDIDETLLEISTDKVESEIPSPVKGRIEKLHFEEGDTVDVGILIAEIEDDLSKPFSEGASTSSEAPAQKASPAPAPAPIAEPTPAPAAASQAQVQAPSGGSGERKFYTPLVKSMAQAHNVNLAELENIQGSGAGGRVNKADLENYLANRGSSAPVQAQAPTSSATADASVGSSSGTGDVEIIPMDNMRKVIAKNMVTSKTTIPHVNSISEVDMTHLVKFREGFKDEFFKQEGFKITYTPFIVRALIMSLKDYPLVNASIDGDNIVVKKSINMGIAVAVPGNGLMVPVIKNAENLGMLGLCRAINDLALRARAKKIAPDELSGGTFTFTNVGSFGTLMATPVILPPQVGIYASGVIQKRPVAITSDSIGIRSMMYGTHTYDHRLVDGELGGKFLETVHRHLREMDPSALF